MDKRAWWPKTQTLQQLNSHRHIFLKANTNFCDCGFQSVCPLMEDKRLLKASWWDRLRGILGLVLMDGALLSKSLIQFFVDGWSCVPSLLFTWGQSKVEVMKIMVTSQKRFHACTATVHAPNPAAGHHWPTPSPETHGNPQARLLCGHCSFLLGPGAQGSVCALQESFPQSYVSSGSSMVGLIVTSSKRTYAIPTPRAPVPVAVHCWPIPPQEKLKHSLCWSYSQRFSV